MKYLIAFLVLLLLIYVAYFSFFLIPLDKWVVVYYKVPGKLMVYKSPGYEFNLLRSIPGNSMVRTFSSGEEAYSFTFEKKVNLFDKEIPLLKYNVELSYALDAEKLDKVFRRFSSMEDINDYLRQELFTLITEKLNTAMENNYNLKEVTKNLAQDLLPQVRNKYEGLTVKKLLLLPLNIIPDFNYRKLSDMVNKSMEYHENFKLDLIQVELEKIKVQKEAENEVAYLRIIGEYIKENPLILKYLLIKHLDKSSVIMLPSSEVGFDFAGTVQERAMKKVLESTNARSY